MNITERRELEAFLKKNRAFAEYKRELREQQGLSYPKSLKSVGFRSALSSVFSWNNSAKGLRFWMSLHKKYVELIGLE